MTPESATGRAPTTYAPPSADALAAAARHAPPATPVAPDERIELLDVVRGFALQYLRAEARGARAATILTRRLLAMLGIGVAHRPLLWYGDILAIYATVGVVLLFQRPAWRRRLGVLAPVARMALTNDLAQTLLALALFYGIGLGLHGRIGPTAQVALSVAIIAAQAVVGGWWLARFRFGPAEWLWRPLTYGGAQPMRVAR